MPSAAFIAAASATNRQPVALLAIESVDAIKRAVTTRPDWEASASPSNINTATEPGRVFLATDDTEPYAGLYYDSVVVNASELEYSGETAAISLADHTVGVSVRYNIRFSSLPAVFAVTYPVAATLYGRLSGGSWENLGSNDTYLADYNPDLNQEGVLTVAGLTRGPWEFKITINYNVAAIKVRIISHQRQHETRYLAAGALTPPAVDLGLVPSIASRLEIDDLVPPGCSMTYAAWGRDSTGDGWISLGAVTDGAALAAHRYYYFSVDLTSSGTQTPYLDEIRVVGGDAQYKYFSTHKDTPLQGARPYIAPGGVSSISSKIDLAQPATVGELTVKLHWTREVGDMIATGYLKNKTIICKIGFLGLSEQDYEPYFTGTWHDYQADPDKALITVKTRNILKKFTRKVPAAGYFLDANGQAFVPPKLFPVSGNIMDCILALVDQLGIPDRYIDRAAFTALAAGARSGPDWDVSRDLTEPTDATDLLNELAVSAGAFLVEGADGKLTVRLFDDAIAAAPSATLDARHHAFKQLDGGQKDLFTRQVIYYQKLPGKDGGSAADYAQGLVYVNATAETAWQESAAKEWLDKWGLSTTAIQRLAQRRDGWYANPAALVKVEGIPPRLWGIQRGQVVAVDNLQLPCASGQWRGFTDGARFLVMGNSTTDPTSDNLSVSLDLLQLGTTSFVPDPDFPTYTPFDFFPTVQALTLSERLVRLPGGSIDTLLDVSFERPADFHYGAATVWASADGGAWVYKGRVEFGGPEPGRVFSFSVAGLTTIEVAVLTVNSGGQTMPLDDAPTAFRAIVGKTAPPADVTDLSAVSNITGSITLEWAPVADVDLKEYVIRYSPLTTSAVWANASEIMRSGGTRATIPVAQTGTYLVKALDSAEPGNYSLNAATVVLATVPSIISLTSYAVIDEAPGWSGTKSNLTAAAGILSLNPTAGNLSGTYQAATEVDFGVVKAARISARSVWELGSMSDSWDDISELDAMTGIDAAAYGGNVQVYIYTSQDASAPAYKQPLFAGDYVFRRARFELVASCINTDTLIEATDFTVNIDTDYTIATI